jgi:exosortase A-associated hydrolase 2
VAVDAAQRVGETCNLLLWQAVGSGRIVLQQFLRLKTASGMLAPQARATTEALRSRLWTGETIEVAGYALSPSLARGLDAASLSPGPNLARLEWVEVARQPQPTLSPAGASAIEAWRCAGWSVRGHVVSGPQFWQAVEIEEAPALPPVTLMALHLEAA